MVPFELPIHGFLLMLNSNIGPNWAPLQDISFQIMSDLDYDFSRSLKVKSNGAVRLLIHDFLFMSNSDHMCISHRLAVIGT